MKLSNRFCLAIAILAVVLLLTPACAPQATPTPKPTPAPTSAAMAATPTPVVPVSPGATATPAPAARPAPGRAAWEGEWETLKEAARKEGKLVIVSGSVNPEVRRGISEAFKKNFGVEAEFQAGRGAETVARLETERRVGIYGADVYVGGTTTPTIEMKPKGLVDPMDKVLFLPEVVDDKNWRLFGLYFDKGHAIAGGFMTVSPYAYINTDLVKPEEIKTLDDLLNPKWKDKIVINDPTTMGTGHSRMWGMKMARGEDFLRKLVEQKPTVVRNQRQLVEWVARGKYPIGLAVPETLAGEFIAAGAKMTAVLAEECNITTGIGAVSLVNRAPHPNAARLFLNWILTREGQNLFARLATHGSRRVDVDNEWLEPILRPRTGVKYFSEGEDIKLEADKEMKLYKEIFKSLM